MYPFMCFNIESIPPNLFFSLPPAIATSHSLYYSFSSTYYFLTMVHGTRRSNSIYFLHT